MHILPKYSLLPSILITTTFFPLQLLIVNIYFSYAQLLTLVSISNHMLRRAIWNKFSEWIFENYKIFKNHEGDLSQKIAWTKHAVTG